MDTEVWARVRSKFLAWAHQASSGPVENVLDQQAGRLIGLSGADRERMRLIVLMDWRARLGDLILMSPTTGFGGFYVIADDARELLPEAAQEWVAAHKEEAVHTDVPTAEAIVDARRWHATQDPDPDLAGALVDVAAALEKAGRPVDAAAAKAEGIDLYRRLARADLATHGPDLAGLLDRQTDATDDLDLLAELVEVYAGLADLDPAAFGEDLGRAHGRIATTLWHANRLEECVVAYRREADVYRRLAADDLPLSGYLASTCETLSKRLSDTDQHDEALSVQVEAVSLRRLLADPAEGDRYRRWQSSRPGDPHEDLGEALADYAARLAGVDRVDEAQTARNEAASAFEAAVALCRPWAEEDFGSRGNTLRIALTTLADALRRADRPDEALAAEEESLAVRRRAVDLEPDADRQDLGIALANLARDLKIADRPDEANVFEEEALTIFRPLAEERPHLLGATLNNYACSLSIQGRFDEAATASAEAVAIYRRLAGDDPGRYTATLARLLWTFAEVRTEGRLDLDAALAAAEETVAIYEKLSADDPAAYAESLSGARTAVDEIRAAR